MSRINRFTNRKHITAALTAVTVVLGMHAAELLAEEVSAKGNNDRSQATFIETVAPAQSILIQTSVEKVEIAEPPLPWPANEPIESRAPSKFDISGAFREPAQLVTTEEASPLPICKDNPKATHELDLAKLLAAESRQPEETDSTGHEGSNEETNSSIPQIESKQLSVKQLEMVAAEADTTHKLTRVIQHSKLALSVQPIKQEDALKIHSIAAWAFVTRGQLKQTRGATVEALQDYTDALVHDPRSFTARQCRGVLFAKSGQVKEAIADFNEAITLNPDNLSMRFNRASLLLSIGEIEKSHSDASYALKLYKTRHQAPPALLASLYELHGTASHLLGKSTQAHNSYTEALSLSSSKGHLYLKRGSLYAAEGIHQLAIDDLLASIKDGTHAESAYRRLAWLLANCQDPHYRNAEQALEAVKRARSLSAKVDAELEEITAAVYAASGDYLKATEHQQKAILLTENTETRDAYRVRLSEYQEALNQPASTSQRAKPASHSQNR